MTGRVVARLSELVDNFDLRRRPVKSSDRGHGRYPYYGASGVVDFIDKHIYDGEYLLISEDGENLRTRATPIAFLARGQFWVNNHAHVVRANRRSDTRYLMYHLAYLDISGYLTGSTLPKLTRSAMDSIILNIPSPADQVAIGRVLGALDDKIAANAELARTADELSRACFDRAMTRPGRTESLLFDRFDVAFGEPFRGSLFSEVGVGRPLIRIRDLYTCAPKLWSTESRVRETLVQAGDVLIGMDAEFTPVVWLGEDGLLNQRVCKVVGRDNLSRVTTRLALTRPISAIESEKSGTTVIHLNKGDLERTRVELPSEHTLEEFDHLANPLHDLTVSLAEESRRLASLRDTLLPHLMSGRMRVRDAEKTVSDAV